MTGVNVDPLHHRERDQDLREGQDLQLQDLQEALQGDERLGSCLDIWYKSLSSH